MQQKLNSLKTFKDNGILVICGMILALYLILLPLSWGAGVAEDVEEVEETKEWQPGDLNEEEKSEFPFTITSNTKFCEGEIKQELRNIISGIQNEDGFRYLMLNAECDYEDERIERAEESRNADRYPGKLTEDGTQQEMPTVMIANGSHEAFKDLASIYGLDASMFWQVENHYGIKEGVVLCITVSETSGGNRGYGKTNPGNVGNNDRGDRVQYAFFETGIEKIGQTLTNKYLGKKQTLGCLSNAGSCTEPYDNGSRYATSESSWEKNMVACLSKIYGPINPSTFNIRR